MMSTSRVPQPVSIMGIDVMPFESYSHALACIENSVAAGRKSFWVAVNPQKMYRAWHDPDLKAILDFADIRICDGVGVSVAAKILHGITLPRCTGCDLFAKLMPMVARRGWGVFLLGASPESNELARRKLLDNYPGIRIAGWRDGYSEDSRETIRQINDSGTDMLFVAMGSPRQEKWIARHMHEIDACFFMGVGGTLDVIGGTVRRAPRVFLRTGTEFLYQLATQPWRWRRQVVYTPFMLRVLERRIWGNRYSGGSKGS